MKQKKTLFRWIWKAYAKSAIVPLIVIELAFLGIYFTSNGWIKKQNQEVNYKEARTYLHELAGLEALEIQKQLQGVSYMTKLYQQQTEAALKGPVMPVAPEDQSRLAYAEDGAYYTTRDREGGAAVFYSGFMPIAEKERNKLAKLLPLQSVMRHLETSHPLVSSVYFNTYDSLNIIYPYFEVLEQYPSHMNIPSYNFYYEADEAHNPERTVKWTDVYLDPAGHGWMASNIAPVYNGDRLEGVVGLDVTVDTIIQNILKLNVSWGGYAVLVGRDGTIIALPESGEADWDLKELTDHQYQQAVEQDTKKPDEFNVYKRKDTAAFSSLMHKEQDGVKAVDFNGKKQIISWATISETGWKLMVMVPEDGIYKDINLFNQALNRVGTGMTIGLVIFYFIFFAWLYRRARDMSLQIAKPLGSINQGLQYIAKQDYRTDYPEFQPENYEVEEMGQTAALLGKLSEELDVTKTDLLRANREIRQREQDLRAIVDSMDDMIFALDESGHVVNLLVQDDSRLQWPTKEFIGKHIDSLTNAETAGKIYELFQLVSETKEPQVLEFQLEGRKQWYQARIAYILGESREAKFSIAVRDVTEHKQAELALIESEARKSSIFQSALDGLLIMDGEGRFLEFNPAAERIFGYTRQQAIGQSMSELIIPPAAREAHEAGMKRYLSTGASRILGKRIEVDGMRADGTEFPMELSVVRIEAEGPPVFTAYVRDITREKLNQRSLIQAKEEAEAANLAKSQFLSQMSHELRTPLNAILGFAQILEMDPSEPLTSNQEESVSEIYKAGNHLLELINEILDLAKIEAGKFHIELEAVEYKALLGECLNLIQPLANERNIRIYRENLNSLPDGLYVTANETKLKQIILNLLSNAVKYNRDHGSIRLQYEIRPGSRIRLSIEDTGHGIPKEALKSIFEPFHRHTHGGRFVEGTGIGLTLSKQLIELMDGAIGVSSDEGRGSIFWIELPLEEEILILKQIVQPLNEVAASVEQAVHHVLYIEDNPLNFKLVQQILKARPDIVLQGALHGKTGLAMVKENEPDVILADMNLPDIDGLELLKQLREDPQTSHIPVIIISANAMPEDVERGIASGCFAYLTKPLKVAELLQTVQRALEQTKM